MSEPEVKRIARDVRTIRNQNLYPAVVKLGCFGIIACSLVGFILFIGVLGVIGRAIGW